MDCVDLSSLLRQLALQHNNRPAVIGESQTLSFVELDRAADFWSQRLRDSGRGPGSHIGLLAGNGPNWLAAAFGVWRAGATLIPISTFVTVRELGEILGHADVTTLIVQPRLRSRDYLADLRQLTDIPKLTAILPLDELTSTPKQEPLGEPRVDPDDIACVLYTSGTTGRPKGVMLQHRAILATVTPTALRTGLSENDVLLSSLPLFWVAGLVIRALPTLACGCALALMETFTVDLAITAMRRLRPTALHLRPPQVGQILAHRNFQPDILSTVIKGGGRSQWYAPHLQQARLITGYGMTEMSGYVVALDWQDSKQQRDNQIGSLLPQVEMRIVDASGDECAAGQSGEIQVRGPGMFAGYYKESHDLGRTADDWFATGDIGSIDSTGRFIFSGRSKDLLRIKGINVSPLEVETVLSQHHNVEAAYVIGLPPDGLDQRLVAVVIGKAGEIDLDDLRHHVRSELSHYKQPEEYVVVQRGDIPLSGTSKPQRAALAELAMARLGNRR